MSYYKKRKKYRSLHLFLVTLGGANPSRQLTQPKNYLSSLLLTEQMAHRAKTEQWFYSMYHLIR
jgi:hypothetical protein